MCHGTYRQVSTKAKAPVGKNNYKRIHEVRMGFSVVSYVEAINSMVEESMSLSVCALRVGGRSAET